MLPKDKGTLIEHQCIVALLELGHHVSVPIGESCPYDFILDFHGELLKIQCKYYELNSDESTITVTFEKNVSTRTQLRSTRYQLGEVDYFATYYNGKCYFIPFTSSRCITLRFDLPRNNQVSKVRYAANYEVDYILQQRVDPATPPRFDSGSAAAKQSVKDKSNSQYGSHWITDGTVNKKIKQGEELLDGFRLGRTVGPKR